MKRLLLLLVALTNTVLIFSTEYNLPGYQPLHGSIYGLKSAITNQVTLSVGIDSALDEIDGLAISYDGSKQIGNSSVGLGVEYKHLLDNERCLIPLYLQGKIGFPLRDNIDAHVIAHIGYNMYLDITDLSLDDIQGGLYWTLGFDSVFNNHIVFQLLLQTYKYKRDGRFPYVNTQFNFGLGYKFGG